MKTNNEALTVNVKKIRRKGVVRMRVITTEVTEAGLAIGKIKKGVKRGKN